MRCPSCRRYHLGPCSDGLRNVAEVPADLFRPVAGGPAVAEPATFTPDDASRILRAWTRANEPRLDYDRVLAPPPPPACPACGGEHRLCATCPACGLPRVPLCDDGQLSAHGSARGGELTDGPLDDHGWPTPGEWSGGCNNRDAGVVPARAAGG